MKCNCIIDNPIKDHKYLIPPKLLPYNILGKYYITIEGSIYGVRGYKLSPQDSPNGLNHPMILNRNLWKLRALMFVPNPNYYSDVIRLDNKIYWISTEVYSKMVLAWSGKVLRKKISQKCIDDIYDLYNKGNTITNIAKTINHPRMTVYRYLQKRELI